MEPGAVVSPNAGETITCLRSAKDGGVFEAEVTLAPGSEGPPTHSHAECAETMEILEGELAVTVDGKEHRLRPGDRLEIPSGVPHSFKVVGDAKVVARGTHGGRFERACDQFAGGGPMFTRLAMYLTYVDPHASYMKSPLARAFLRVIAVAGKIRGVKVV
jgi:quercetin dioxygenase-like cupin family protein